MFDIRLEGYSVDIKPQTQVILESFSPVFDFDTVQGSRVNSFTLPDTPTNRRILGNFNDPAEGVSKRAFFCEKYVDSQLRESGYVRIQQATDGEITLYFAQNLGEIFGDRQLITLAQMDFPALGLSAPTAAANHLADPYCYPSIENAAFYGNIGYGGIINPYDAAQGKYGANPLVPHFFLKWVLDNFGKLAGWKFQGKFWADPDLARLCLANLFSLDGATQILPKNHLPDLTAGGTLIELRKLFNLYLDFDVRRKVCDMGFVDDVLAAPTLLDWTDKLGAEHPKTPITQNRLQLGFELDGNDGLMKPIPADLDLYTTPENDLNRGGTTQLIKSRFSTYLTNPASGLATCSQAGISPTNKDSNNQGGTPKLLFWNGLVNGKPTATNASGARRLAWRGGNNLVDMGFKRFERMKADTFNLKKFVMLTPADLAQFDYRKKIHFKGLNYLPVNMKAVLQRDQRVIPAEIDFVKV